MNSSDNSISIHQIFPDLYRPHHFSQKIHFHLITQDHRVTQVYLSKLMFEGESSLLKCLCDIMPVIFDPDA